MRHLTLCLLTLLAVHPAWAQDAPKRKSGLWEIIRTSTYTEGKPKRIQLCVDQASDNPLKQLAEGMRGEACTTNKLSHDGDKLVVDATCTLRDSTAQTHAVISGTFDSAYTVESKSTYKPPLAGAAAGHARFVARWTGPCAPNLHPGEAILDSGAIADSSGKLQPAPKVKTAKPEPDPTSTHGKHLTKLPPGGTPGAMPGSSAKSVKPAAKSATPAATGTPPATNAKSVAPAATVTPPAANQ